MEIDEVVLTGASMPIHFKTVLMRSQGFLLKLDEERNGVWVEREDKASSHFVPMSSISHMRAVPKAKAAKAKAKPAAKRGRKPKSEAAGATA